jgi:hypothetical protein
MSDRLTEIKEQLAEAKRGAVFPSCERDDTDKRWLVAEVARLRSVETDFHQLSDVAGWHHGETQIALARAKQAESDLAALRQRHAEAERDLAEAHAEYQATLEKLADMEERHALEADHIVGLGNMVEVAREGTP